MDPPSSLPRTIELYTITSAPLTASCLITILIFVFLRLGLEHTPPNRMRVLFFSRDYMTHDRRFLKKLSASRHEIFFCASKVTA